MKCISIGDILNQIEPNFQEVRKKERVLQECQNNELEKLREQNLKLKAENEAYSAKIENIMAILPKTLENHLLVHKLEKENLQLRKIVDQAEKVKKFWWGFLKLFKGKYEPSKRTGSGSRDTRRGFS